MSYATVADLRQYIAQVPDTTEYDLRLLRVLERATAIVDDELGYSFAGLSGATRTIYGDGTTFLRLPRCEPGSVTSVTSVTSVIVPSYVEDGPYLRVVDSQGIRPSYRRANNRYSWYTGYEDDVTNGNVVLFGGGQAGAYWREGVPYTIAAAFGTGTPPPDITEATLEIATAIWRQKDGGFATVMAVEGAGVVNIRNALPLKAQLILNARKAKRADLGVC